MQDQVMALKNKGISSNYVGGGQDINKILNQAFNGELKLLYITPEFAAFYFELIKKIHQNCPGGIRCIAIDEAHCISQWGHDFRPTYQELKKLRSISEDIPFLAVSATATPQVQQDIIESLQLKNPALTLAPLDKENLYIELKKKTNIKDDIKECSIK